MMKNKKLYAVFILLVCMIISFMGGMMVGNDNASRSVMAQSSGYNFLPYIVNDSGPSNVCFTATASNENPTVTVTPTLTVTVGTLMGTTMVPANTPTEQTPANP